MEDRNYSLNELTKPCKTCLAIKPIGEFYFHGLSKSHESTCKQCKKTKRKSKASLASSAITQDSKRELVVPEQIIEPEKFESSNASGDDLDFSMWERIYSRRLTDLERQEIRANLFEFAEILLSEYKKGEGL